MIGVRENYSSRLIPQKRTTLRTQKDFRNPEYGIGPRKLFLPETVFGAEMFTKDRGLWGCSRAVVEGNATKPMRWVSTRPSGLHLIGPLV